MCFDSSSDDDDHAIYSMLRLDTPTNQPRSVVVAASKCCCYESYSLRKTAGCMDIKIHLITAAGTLLLLESNDVCFRRDGSSSNDQTNTSFVVWWLLGTEFCRTVNSFLYEDGRTKRNDPPQVFLVCPFCFVQKTNIVCSSESKCTLSHSHLHYYSQFTSLCFYLTCVTSIFYSPSITLRAQLL